MASTGRLFQREPRARLWLGFATLIGTLQTAAAVAVAFLFSLAVARVFLEGDDRSDVAVLIVVALVLVIVRAVLGVIGSLSAQHAGRRVVDRSRRDITAHLLRLGPAYLGREQSGDFAGLLVSGMESLEAYVASYLPARNLALAVPLLVMAVVLFIDPLSVLVLLLTGPVLLLLLIVIGSRTRAISERRFGELRWLSSFFLDVLRGLPTLKIFGRSEEQVDNLRDVGDSYSDSTLDVLRTAFQTSLVLEWSAAIAMALVAVEVGLRLLAGSVPFDRALAVLVITPEFFLPLRNLSSHYHEGSAGTTVIDRASEIMSVPVAASPRATPESGAARRAVAIAADVRLKNVTFTYPGREAAALLDLTLTLRQGRSLALVGESGAGKSTLGSLLLRFMDPDEGVIEVGGRDLREIDLSDWRASVSWVPQLPHLFHGSVLDNIRLGRPAATEMEIEVAARAAHAHEFIARLPHGYLTALGEGGSRLSGGQRQRIAIARAFLREAPLVLLDEAMSHQDDESERALASAISALAAERTVLVISHRLHFASTADWVVVLGQGRLLEQGPPEILAAQAGAYRRLLDSRRIDDGGSA